jgi:MOSC domain-containing protein YiiM
MSFRFARIFSINVNPQGGVPKRRVPNAMITVQGVVGDKQRDLRFHGGPTRAVSLFALERIQQLQSEGHPINSGSTGENLTVVGLDWSSLAPGDCLRIGEHVRIAVTGFAAPCQNIAASFRDGQFSRISQKLHPGWSRLYARVLTEGMVSEGDRIVFDVVEG